MFQKSHACTNCRRTLNLEKVHVVFETDNMVEARAYLQELKKRDASKTPTIEFTTADKL